MVVRPRQERAVRTREAILRAAAEVFDETGYEGAGIARILAKAGVTQGAMYFHFASKAELARAVMLEQAADVSLPDHPAGLRQLVEVTLMLAEELRTNVLLRAGVRLAVDPSGPVHEDNSIYGWWAERFRLELQLAAEQGDVRPDVDAEEFAQTLVGAFTGTQILSQMTSGRADLPRRIVGLWRYLLPGIATPEGLSRVVLADLDVPAVPAVPAVSDASAVPDVPVDPSTSGGAPADASTGADAGADARADASAGTGAGAGAAADLPEAVRG
ncbi:TetR/AcrR family transcriptional regulator [Streptomyces sp. LP05-1]|uniref:TetR/AcrR family transcriptional regulator n=1 Tax=Streptomyces pyxinae TaxID=2970734 RepID=A0ABT2CLM6_9ACTN|nr:ScbR family autoregulator-binding transcription factor [Streptomyces sp. LP05-1]MCS0638220.1 TetR/AcrR family transcriptional regulator [Streptomyces sp. LP05-1]